MTTVLYTLWFLVPLFFIVLATWSKLEQASGRERRENIGDYLRQGGFALICVLVSLIIDQFFLEDLVMMFSSDSQTIGVARIMLLPVIFILAAKIIGPSKQIRIEGKGRLATKTKSRKR